MAGQETRWRVSAVWRLNGSCRRRSWRLPDACAADEFFLCGCGAGESPAGGWVRTLDAPQNKFTGIAAARRSHDITLPVEIICAPTLVRQTKRPAHAGMMPL